MKNVVLCAVFLSAAAAFGQTPPPPPSAEAVPSHQIEVKSSPAEDALLEQTKQATEAATAINALLQQAQADLEKKNKPLTDELAARSKKWQDKMNAENKDLIAKIKANNDEATARFQQETASLQAKGLNPQTVTTLSDIVKKEQNLPADAFFDPAKKAWFVPDAKK